MGSDPKKLEELQRPLIKAQAAAQKYVVPNQFTDVAERNGAHGLNAETGLDDTMYFWSMPENRLELWAWLESSRLADTVPREFYKERSVVLEERRMRTDSNPRAGLVEQLAATAYVAHNYGRSGMGWPSEVSQITATEAMAFHKKYYVGSNIVIAVVGDVKAAEAMPILEKYFSRVPRRTEAAGHDDGGAKAVCREVGRSSRTPASRFTSRSYHRPSYRSPDDAVYDAISDIMSNGRVSRLYRSLVRDQQIAAEAAGSSPFPRRQVSQPLRIWRGAAAGHIPMRRWRPRFTKKLKS